MNDSDFVEDEGGSELSDAPARAEYDAYRAPRRGSVNPEDLTNPVWLWILKHELNPYLAADHYGAPSAIDVGPGWTNDRLGQSRTEMADGRVIMVAGEHEDSYDPDFFIYNDVIVRWPDGRVKIFGYPEAEFPATDFHSATLVGEKLFLVGNLGYDEKRKYGECQVCVLDTSDYRMKLLETSGDAPSLLHDHEAKLVREGEAILVRGGKVIASEESDILENIDEYELNLKTLVWTRLTKRVWKRFEFRSLGEGGLGMMDEPRQKDFEEQLDFEKMAEASSEEIEKMMGEMDMSMMAQKGAMEAFFDDTEYEVVPGKLDEDGFPVDPFEIRLRVDGVIVKYRQEFRTWEMMVQGDLPEARVRGLREDLERKLTAFFEVKVESRLVENP